MAEKPQFDSSSVSFLGFVVQQGQLLPDPVKVSAMWPTPSTHKQLQRSLGLANFYHQAIRDYSKVVTPLSCLTSTRCHHSLAKGAEATFPYQKLSSRGPILYHSHLGCQFGFEVDALAKGVRAVLS